MHKITTPRVVSMVVFAIALSACISSPVVPTRSLSYTTTFVVDRQTYKLVREYLCHYEDIGWLSARGSSWHIRNNFSNFVAVEATRANGEKFWIATRGEQLRYDRARCPDKTTDVMSFVYSSDPTAKGAPNNIKPVLDASVQILESKLIYLSSGLGLFKY